MIRRFTSISILLACAALLLGQMHPFPGPGTRAVAAGASAPTFVAMSVVAGHLTGDVTVVLPTHQANDILILGCWKRDVDDTVTVTDWTAVTGSPWDRGTTSRYWLFWLRAASADTADPICNQDTDTANTFGVAVVYRGATTSGTPIEAVGAFGSGTNEDPSVLGGISTLTANALVIAYLSQEDDSGGLGITSVTGTDPETYTSHWDDDGTGTDTMMSFSEAARTSTGATGDVSVNRNLTNFGYGGLLLSLKP